MASTYESGSRNYRNVPPPEPFHAKRSEPTRMLGDAQAHALPPRSGEQDTAVAIYLTMAKRRQSLVAAVEAAMRAEALEDRQIRQGIGIWPSEVFAERKKNFRPCLTIDKISGAIRQETGRERSARSAIQVNPVGDGADQRTAKILQGIIRHCENDSDAEIARDHGFDDAVTAGRGAWRVVREWESDDSFRQVLRTRWIENPECVYYDPTGSKPDFSDANFCIIVEDVPRDVYIQLYPDSMCATLANFESVGDQAPDWFPEGKIRIAEQYDFELIEQEIVQVHRADKDGNPVRDAAGMLDVVTMPADELPEDYPEELVLGRRLRRYRQLRYAKFNALEILDGNEDLTGPRDEPGDLIPVIVDYGELMNINGKRHWRGLIRTNRDALRMYSFIWTAITEKLALSNRVQYLLTPQQVEGYEDLWSSNRNLPYRLYNHQVVSGAVVPPPILQESEPAIQGWNLLLQRADMDIRSGTSFFDAADPNRPNAEQSGRAILARTDQAEETNGNFLDNHHRAVRHEGRIYINLIPFVYWEPGRVVQITGVDDSTDTVMLNQPFQPSPNGPVPVNPAEVEERDFQHFRLEKGRYSIEVTAGLSFKTKRLQAASGLLEIITKVPEMAPSLLDIWAKYSDGPEAPDLHERLKKMLPPNLQDTPGGAQSAEALQALVGQLKQQLQTVTQAAQGMQQVIQTKQIESDGRMRVELIKLQSTLATEQGETARALLKAQIQKIEGDLDRHQALLEAAMKREHDLNLGTHAAIHEGMASRREAIHDGMADTRGHIHRTMEADQGHAHTIDLTKVQSQLTPKPEPAGGE